MRAAQLLAVALLVVFEAPAVASADPVLTIVVDVSSAPVAAGQPPIWSISPYPNASELPPGTQLQGHAECSQVFVSGDSGATEPIENASGVYDPTPGTYNFVDSSCTQDPAFPVSLTNTTGNYNIVFHGGSITVSLTATAVHGLGVQTFDSTGIPTSAKVEAVVTGDDDQQLAGVPVTFAFDSTGGIPLFYSACAGTKTVDDGAGDYIATCTLGPADAKTFYAGTGGWTASYGGDSSHQASTFAGQLGGQTTAAQAAVNYKKQSVTVKIVPVQIPPNCNPYANVGDNGSLIDISLGELSCSQLKVLQIVTGIAIGAATVVTGGADAVFDFISDVLANWQYQAVLLGGDAAKGAAFG